MAKDENRTVWSSTQGDLRRQKPAAAGSKSLPPQGQTAYLHRESGGRHGKAVTLVKNLALTPEDSKALARLLKQECGTGGAVKAGVIEIQGDQRERIAAILQKLGYRVKIAGG